MYEIPKQTVNNLVKQFVAQNILYIEVSEKDRREKQIRFTEFGEKYAEDLLKPVFEFNEKLVSKVGIKVVKQISDGLNKLSAAIVEIDKEVETQTNKGASK